MRPTPIAAGAKSGPPDSIMTVFQERALFIAALWMIPGAMLLIIYQVFTYRTFGGKVVLGQGTHY